MRSAASSIVERGQKDFPFCSNPLIKSLAVRHWVGKNQDSPADYVCPIAYAGSTVAPAIGIIAHVLSDFVSAIAHFSVARPVATTEGFV